MSSARPARVAACDFADEPAADGCVTHSEIGRRASIRNRRRMGWALALAATYMIVEVIGGLLSNSLALLADAGHMATDVAALTLALWAMWLSGRPATPRRTYGYHRAEILAALINGAVLIALSGYIIFEAVQRLRQPPEVAGGIMLAVAIGGLLVNGAAVLLLEGGRHESLNVRAAWLHVLSDALGSVGVVAGAILVLALGWSWADPLAAILIALLILYSSWSLLREAVDVLMASAPDELDTDVVRAALAEVGGVDGIHDLHVWTLTSGIVMLTAHATLEPDADSQGALRRMCEIARDRFGIRHCTIQPEVGAPFGGEPVI